MFRIINPGCQSIDLWDCIFNTCYRGCQEPVRKVPAAQNLVLLKFDLCQ